MSYVSLNPPGPSLPCHQNQIFIHPPNNQDCRTLFDFLDPRQTLEIGELRENYHQKDGKMLLQEGSSSNNNNNPQPFMEEYQASNASRDRSLSTCKTNEELTESKNIISHGSPKWMSSKMRLMKKMMTNNNNPNPMNNATTSSTSEEESSIIFQNYYNKGQENNNNYNYRRSPGRKYYYSSSSTRVCSDCNTNNTPLWRSGPKGPKSLCNACGIRQRKARRAMAEEAGNYGLTTTKTRMHHLHHNKEKKSRTNKYNNFVHHFKNNYKSTHSATSFQPRDNEVAEAALLLMDLSCGF